MTRWLNTLFPDGTDDLISAKHWSTLPRYDRIRVLRAYYDSDDLYERVTTGLEEQVKAKSKLLALRNPTRQVCEFHVTHVVPGGPIDESMPIDFPVPSDVPNAPAEQPKPVPTPKAVPPALPGQQTPPPALPNGNGNGNGQPLPPTNPTGTANVQTAVLTQRQQALREAITQVWEWSNFAAKIRAYLRSFSRDGDLFIKVVEHNERDQVFFQWIDPADVWDWDTDERGFITWIRIDVQKIKRDSKGKTSKFFVTEVWSKDDQTMTIYEHEKDRGTDLDKLGNPVSVTALTSEDPEAEEFGIDFIPIVYAPFKDVGKKEGEAAISGALDKIDELNRQATRLHRLIFRANDVNWVLRANAVDPTGRPMPAPIIEKNEDGEMEIGGERIARLPGMSILDPLVPNINYEAALSILESHQKSMENDLPEMAYARLRDAGDLSGRAIQLKLTEAIARAEEARANFEAAIVRADQMALTIAQRRGLKGFTVGQIGNFESGDFNHKFKSRPIIPIPVSEQAETFTKLTQGQMPVVPAMRIAGFSEEDIDDVATERAADSAAQATNFAAGVLQATSQIEQNRKAAQPSEPPPKPEPVVP